MLDTSEVLESFQIKAGITFQNKELLQQALTHSSFAKKSHEKGISDNERLEFFGDAVLKLVVSEYLFQEFPELSEGPLTKKRAQIISDKFLSEIATQLQLGSFLFLSYSEKQTGGAARPSILANAFEALLGAYYLDSGYEPVKLFFLRWFKACSEGDSVDLEDYKTTLQECLQKKSLSLPSYQLLETEGPEHKKVFHIEVIVNLEKKTLRRKAKGYSKKEAEQAAAKRLLEALEKA